jgi:hypothetical protein
VPPLYTSDSASEPSDNEMIDRRLAGEAVEGEGEGQGESEDDDDDDDDDDGVDDEVEVHDAVEVVDEVDEVEDENAPGKLTGSI